MYIREQIGLSFDDVLLVPRKSTIRSRFDGGIDLSVQLTPNVNLKYPIISAAMDTITMSKMANAMAELGCLGIIHRFMDDTTYLKEIEKLNGSFVGCIGLGEKGIARIDQLLDVFGNRMKAISIDVAYAHTPYMEDFIRNIKNKYGLDIIVGSVATGQGVYDLCVAGADAIRVGVGPGSMCSTRVTTGNGVPQITALMEAREAVNRYCMDPKNHWSLMNTQSKPRKVTIICDGGVKNGGDCVKALAAGADAIITGNLLAGTDETPGDKVIMNNTPHKVYRGMSSKEAQMDWKGTALSIEGALTYIPCKGPVKEVIDGLVGNILSGMSYQDSRNIEELQSDAEFVRITGAGMKESIPHGKRD